MRSLRTTLFAVLSCTFWHTVAAIYNPLREYAGTTFFDGWDYWGNVDNTTWGNVTYVDRAHGTSSRLTYVNNAGNAIVKVDNTTTIADAALVNRGSVRLTTKDSYGVGTVVIVDALHIPYGCSVWPSFWTLGAGGEWPAGGEIDIIEGINMMGNNQMALHSKVGCTQAANPAQSGRTLATDCSLGSGCFVAETKPNSFGEAFARAGGGVFATQIDVAGVFMWFWSRPDVPESIKSATAKSTIDTTLWGMPSAAFPASGCNITQFFDAQQLVLLTTLCGSWAGVPGIYSKTCPGSCIRDNIIGPGSPKYDQAYWEISYIRTYLVAPPAPVSSSSTGTPSSASQPPAASSSTPTFVSTPTSRSTPTSSLTHSAPQSNVTNTSSGHQTAVSVLWLLLSFGLNFIQGA